MSNRCTNKGKWLLGIIGALLTGLLSLTVHAAETVHACAANLEYPPYLFTKREGDSESMVGVAVDVLQLSLKKAGKPPAQIQKLPWLRCLKLAEVGEIDVVLNVPTAQIDPEPYRITQPYAVVHSVYVTSRTNSPKGLTIRTVEDLNRYRICGLLGMRYDSYGIDTAKVDTGANTYLSLINKLMAGHCDLFLEKREIIDALQARSPELKAAFTSSSLVESLLPEDSPLGLHYAISRRIPNSQALADQLDATIAVLQDSKQLEKWISAYTKKN
jgi:polar amino acid transport system substrate-binding protein